MHGGFRRLIYPGTEAGEIDVEGTRLERERINEAICQQLRQLAELEAQLNGRKDRSADDRQE